MASNYVNLSLVPISFLVLAIPWTFYFRHPRSPILKEIKEMLVVSYLGLQASLSLSLSQSLLVAFQTRVVHLCFPFVHITIHLLTYLS